MVLLVQKRHKHTSSIPKCILDIVLLLIDNYDSFTYNLVQRIGEHDLKLGISREMKIVRNDLITVEDAVALSPSRILISPGPCTPGESGICKELVEHFAGVLPILGVCLGHQVIGELYGMAVTPYSPPVHGKTSPVFHDNTGVFAGLPNPFDATRYHSLVIECDSIPENFCMNAWTEDGMCMGIRRIGEGAPLEGVQFHPESFLTANGPEVLGNFLRDYH